VGVLSQVPAEELAAGDGEVVRCQVHAYARAHIRTHARTHARTHMHTRTHCRARWCAAQCTHTRTHARTRTHAHANSHAHAHSHAHARTHTHCQARWCAARCKAAVCSLYLCARVRASASDRVCVLCVWIGGREVMDGRALDCAKPPLLPFSTALNASILYSTECARTVHSLQD
jgi:hypothetical protein